MKIRADIATLLHEGHSDLEIHRRTGTDRGTVARYRKHLGLPGYRTTADSPACRHGHPFPENAARTAEGWLYCRECRRQTNRAASARRYDRSRLTQTPHRYQPPEPDWAAIERATAGDPPERMTPRERAAAVAKLESWGLKTRLIAGRTRCHERTVYRIRARLAAVAP